MRGGAGRRLIEEPAQPAPATLGDMLLASLAEEPGPADEAATKKGRKRPAPVRSADRGRERRAPPAAYGIPSHSAKCRQDPCDDLCESLSGMSAGHSHPPALAVPPCAHPHGSLRTQDKKGGEKALAGAQGKAPDKRARVQTLSPDSLASKYYANVGDACEDAEGARPVEPHPRKPDQESAGSFPSGALLRLQLRQA